MAVSETSGADSTDYDDVIKSNRSSSTTDPESSTLTDVLYQWSSETSIHGVPYALNVNFKAWRKVLWALLSLTALVAMTIQIRQLLMDYRKYEVNSNVQVVSPSTLPFPEVTVCNINSIQRDKVINTLIGEPQNEDDLIAISQSREDFIMATVYDDEFLNISEHWKPVITHKGLCWRFNTDKTVTLPGDASSGGLWIGLSVNKAQYIVGENGVLTAGVNVFVAQPNATRTTQMPLGLVRPGETTFIALHRTVIQRETRKPWSRCIGKAPYYTQQSCREECLYQAYRRRYGCRDIGDPSTEGDYCNSIDGLNATTIASIVKECVTLNCSIPSCYEEVYTTSVSSLPISGNNRNDSAIFEEEVLTLRLNYDTMKETMVTESRAVTPSALWGTLGGIMGLYLGISSLSVVEVVGELGLLRLLPRLFGNRQLYGIGSKEK
jgi:hypothetical protein